MTYYIYYETKNVVWFPIFNVTLFLNDLLQYSVLKKYVVFAFIDD